MPFNADLRGVATELLLSYYRHNAPGVLAFVEGIGDTAQVLENMIGGVQLSNTIELATGELLDQWGVLVGEERGGVGDADYRRFIRGRALANRCRGSLDEMIALWKVLMSPTTSVLGETFPPATLYLHAYRNAATFGDALLARNRRILEAAKPAGVQLDLREITLLPPFGFTSPPAGGFGVGYLATAF